MATMTREEQLKLKEEQLFSIFEKRMKGGGVKSPEDLGFKKSDIINGINRLKGGFMSLVNFSPEVTILNISSQPELLKEYLSAIFGGLNKTSDKKISHDFDGILEKIDSENPDNMLSSFIYDSISYFQENPISITDSDLGYKELKLAQDLSKRIVNGPYKITKQEPEIEAENIDVHKLVKLLVEENPSLSQRDVINILKKLYGVEKLNELLSKNN
ncbi:MAG: hypothetical protein HHAS10_04620 [Candidatus Altimarinota bacterium]